MKNDVQSQVFDSTGGCQAWVLRPLDKGLPTGLLVVVIVTVIVVWWLVAPHVLEPGLYYPTTTMGVLAAPFIFVVLIVYAMLFAKWEVRVGRDGVYRDSMRRSSFVAWDHIKEVDVKPNELDVMLDDGRKRRLRFARSLTSAEEADLGSRISMLRSRPLKSHPLAMHASESPEAWLARVKAASPGVGDYRHKPTEHAELFAVANDRDMVWTARLAALVRIHLANVEEFAVLQARVSSEYADPSVRTAFRVVDLGDSALVRALKFRKVS